MRRDRAWEALREFGGELGPGIKPFDLKEWWKQTTASDQRDPMKAMG